MPLPRYAGGKFDIISDGLIHYQILRFCQNTRLAFLGRNTPTPLISDIFANVDATILEALCRKGTTDAHGEWTAVFRRFADTHTFKGFGITPNAGSAISAFYAASVSLVQWLGFCSHAEQNFIDLASTWAPGQDLANPDQWSAPILLALKQADKVLLTDFGCHEWSIDGPAPASAVPQIEGSSPNPAANAPQSASSNTVPPLTLLPLKLLYSTQTVDSNFGWQRKGAVCTRAACDHGSPHALLALSSIRARQHLFNSQRANSRSTELAAFQGLPHRSR